MTTVYASVDGPPLRIVGQHFEDGLHLICQGTYGRVLFTTHDALIAHCYFGPKPKKPNGSGE